MSNYQDWEPQVIRKTPVRSADARSKNAVNMALRSGVGVETEKKFNGGGNRQHQGGLDTAKLDRETDVLSHEKVNKSVAQAIQQGRQAKGMTQKELATAVNEKPQIVNEYEAGKAIPNNIILGKLERALGIKLRGKDIGKPLPAKAPAAAAGAKK